MLLAVAPVLFLGILAAAVLVLFVLGSAGGAPSPTPTGQEKPLPPPPPKQPAPNEQLKSTHRGFGVYTKKEDNVWRWTTRWGETSMATGTKSTEQQAVEAAKAWIDLILTPKVKPIEPDKPLPTPEPSSQVPSWVKAGGAPEQEIWWEGAKRWVVLKPVAWYSYHDRQFWIRVDDLDRMPSGDSGITPNVIIAGERFSLFPTDTWTLYAEPRRWAVMAGESETPLATQVTFREIEAEIPSEDTASEHWDTIKWQVRQQVAREAADWIDLVAPGATTA